MALCHCVVLYSFILLFCGLDVLLLCCVAALLLCCVALLFHCFVVFLFCRFVVWSLCRSVHLLCCWLFACCGVALLCCCCVVVLLCGLFVVFWVCCLPLPAVLFALLFGCSVLVFYCRSPGMLWELLFCCVVVSLSVFVFGLSKCDVVVVLCFVAWLSFCCFDGVAIVALVCRCWCC